MAETLRIYWVLVKSRVRAQTEYRASFVLACVMTFLVTFVDFVVVLVLFHQVPVIAGWGLAEVAFLYGVSCTTFGLVDVAIGHIEKVHLLVLDGRFDSMLIRPVGTLPQLAASDFKLTQLGKALQGLIVLVAAMTQVGIDWTPARAVVFASMFVSGGVIFGALWVMLSTITFWTVGTAEVANAFTYGGNALTQWPMNVYGPWLRRLLGFVIPLAFVNYFPALYVLGKADPLGLPLVLQFLGPVAAVVMAVVASRVWRVSVRRYRSTGS